MAFWPRLLRGGVLEGQVWCPLEDDRDLGDALAETLARAQVERDTCPAPGVDLERHRSKGLGDRLRVDAVLVEVADDLFGTLPTGRVLPARGALVEVRREADRREHLLLLGAKVLGVEGDRLLHGREGQEPGAGGSG